MTGTNHGMTGAVIALMVKQPLLAVPLAFIGHFLQDMLPHWNYGVDRSGKKPKFFSQRFFLTLTLDFLLALILMVILARLFPAHIWLIWACMIAAASPDLMYAYHRLYLGHIKKTQPSPGRFYKAHIALQGSETSIGALVEIAWFLVSGIIILSLR